MECFGGAQQVATATQSQHAVPLGQIPVFGGVRNLKASLAAAGTSLTFTADAIVVKSALNGISTLLTNYNQALSLAAGTGAGKMDTGTAPTSGYVAVYATWGPAVGAGIVGQNATSAAVPEQYGGANIPAGVTETQLIGVWPTNASGQFQIGFQRDRIISFPNKNILTTAAILSTPTVLIVSAGAPLNAISVSGGLGITSTSSSNMILTVMADVNFSGIQQNSGIASNVTIFNNFSLHILTPQTIYLTTTSSAGTPSFVVYLVGYTF
jgi:hypothetical protein